MPIVVVPYPSAPPNVLGPGLSARFTSDFTGPLPSDANFLVNLDATEDPATLFATITVPTPEPFTDLPLLLPNSGWEQFVNFWPVDGQQTFVRSFLREGATVIDSGTASFQWDATSGLSKMLLNPTTSGGGGGLTPAQDQALQEIHQGTALDQLLDALTLELISPAGGGPGPFNRTLLTPTAGVLVRMTAIAAGLVPDTPDGDYWLPSLAVIRLFRGADLWHRVPVHTSSKLYYWLDENVTAFATNLLVSQWLLNMSVQVTIREGCQAEVFLLHYP